MNNNASIEKRNIIVEFFEAWLYLFLYAFKGIIYLLYGAWVDLVMAFSNTKTQNVVGSIDEMASIYERTKSKEKKVHQYHYSTKQMAKYAKMKEALMLDLQQAGATRSKIANVYRFTVRNPENGHIFTDSMSGFSKLDINSFLVNEGYEVYSIQTSKWINFAYKETSLGGKISIKDLVFWLTQLSTYLKAGITLNEATKILTAQLKKDKKQHKIMKSLSYELSLGESFSNALEKQGDYFPALLINMIKAAEASGTLQETLSEMANYYTEVNNTRKEMISALTYPAIIIVFAFAVVTFIIVYVVPQFTEIYASNGIKIAGLTKVVIDLSNFLQKNLMYVLICILAAIVIIVLLYQKVKIIRVNMQKVSMKIPVISKVIIYKEINIFSKTFASLLRNNVYITESMDILSKITSNEIYKSIMYKTINNIVNGEKISDAFKNHWAVPDVAYYMIVTGESTGQLGEMMQKVSDYYQQEHKTIVNALKSLIEPVLIVFLAVMVGAIILAVIVPMFSMYNQIL